MIKYSAFFKRLSAACSVVEKLGETVKPFLVKNVISVPNAKNLSFANEVQQS